MGELEVNRGLLELNESFTDEEYNNTNCISYSILKDIHYNPEVLTKERLPSDKEWLIFGTLVDLMVTQDGDIYDKVLVNDTVPTDQYKKMADYILENQLNINKLTDQEVEEIYFYSGSKVNWTVPVKKTKLLENCIEYISLLTTHADKLIVSTDMFNEATNISQTLMTHRWTKHLFMSKKEQLENHIEIIYQYKIKYIYKGLQCKSKIDILVIDHDAKTITLYDVKTGIDYPQTFATQSLFKYKYCYQAALYTEGFKIFKKKMLNLAEYKLEDFRFVYISRLKPTYPIKLRITPAFHNQIVSTGIEGNTYSIPALNDLCVEVEYYLKEMDAGNMPTEPMELVLTDGELDVVSVDGYLPF